jgi:hypothetical protein
MPTAWLQHVLATAITDSDPRYRHGLENISPDLKTGACAREAPMYMSRSVRKQSCGFQPQP